MAVDFVSVGYGIDPYEEIDAAEWAEVLPKIGRSEYGVLSAADWAATRVIGERQVRISAGSGYGRSVFDTTVDEDILTFTSPGSGSRWDMVAANRNWTTGSRFKIIPGGPSAVLPTRATNPPTEDDQPLYLARVSAAQVEELIDLRMWVGPGGATANHKLVLSYLEGFLGTQIYIAGELFFRYLNTLGAASWGSIGGKAPVPARFEATFRRSDGQLALNTGQTLMKWQNVTLNTLGATVSAGPNGAVVILPAGQYRVSTSQLFNALTGQTYVRCYAGGSGYEILAPGRSEQQVLSQYNEAVHEMEIFVAESASLFVTFVVNATVTPRTDGVIRIFATA